MDAVERVEEKRGQQRRIRRAAERGKQPALASSRRRARQDRNDNRSRFAHHTRNSSKEPIAKAQRRGNVMSALTSHQKWTTARIPATYTRRWRLCQRRPIFRIAKRFDVMASRKRIDERRHPDGDERPLADIHDHGRDVEVVDEHDPRQHVQRGIEEGEQAEHPPQLDEVVPAGDTPERRHRRARS